MAIVMSPAMKQMDKIIDRLYARPDAAPFREPVNWRELGLFDYPELIKRPMALTDVKAKLTAGQYRNPVECAEDVNLIWQNCMTYNMDGSEFYKLANKFRKAFQEQFTKVKQSNDAEEARNAVVDLDRQPTLDEQTQFAHNIYMIKSEELGEVITKLDESCPTALDKKQPDKDELEINIDGIDPRTFHLLDRLIRGFLPDTAKKAKKKKGPGDLPPAGTGTGQGASKKQKVQ